MHHSFNDDTTVHNLVFECKHGKVDKSWSLPSFKWKWFKSTHRLWIFFLENIHRRFKKHIDLQTQAIYVDKNNCKRNLNILEDNASGAQVGDVEQVSI